MVSPGLDALDDHLLDGLVFCATAHRIFDVVRSAPRGVEELRLRRTRRSKKLLEEVLPLAAFVQSHYGPGCRVRVRWIDGSQPYDARLLWDGAAVKAMKVPRVQYVEITTAVHQNAYLVREQLQDEGLAFGPQGAGRDPKTGKAVTKATAHDISDTLAEIAALIRSRITEKASKDYPRHTSLVVGCELHVPLEEDEWQKVLDSLRTARHRFREVVLVDHASCRVTTLRSVTRATDKAHEGAGGS